MYLSVIETTSHQYNALLVSGTGLDGISQSILLYRWHLRAHNHHRHEHTWVHDYSCLLLTSCLKWWFSLTGLELILSQFQPKWTESYEQINLSERNRNKSAKETAFLSKQIFKFIFDTLILHFTFSYKHYINSNK